VNLALPRGAAQIVRRATRLDFIDGLGIAIGQRHVAIAHLVKRLATVSLQHHLVAPLPPVEEADARRGALAQVVSGFLAAHSIGADRAFVTLPRASALLSRLALPAAAKKDVRQVVEFEIDRILPVSRDEVYFDFLERDAGTAERLDILVIAALRRVVTDHLGALETAGVRARSVSITPVALLDLLSFVSGGADANVIALVDDDGVVEMDFLVGKTLRSSHLVRPEEVSSPAVIDRLVFDEATSAAVAAGEVRVYAWAAAAPPAANDGPTSMLPAELLPSGVELMRRLDGMLAAPEGFFANPDPTLLPAIGAALGAVREGEADLNLLPPEERRAVEEGAPVLTFLCAAVLVVVMLVWLASAMFTDYRIAGKLHAELEALEPQIRQVHRNEEEAKEVRDRLALLTQGDRRRIGVLLKDLTEAVPESAYLSTFRLRNDRVELEGFAKSASDLVPLLEKSRHFRNAQFTSPVTKVQNNQERFSLTTEIEE
jgi:Tfp pilus assembly protein PilN